MANAQQLQTGYGLTSALPFLANPPIVAKRAPTAADKAQIGTEWVYPATNTAYILTSIVNNSATWTAVGGGGGAGVFLSVTSATFVNAGTTITAAGTITTTAGNVQVTAGNINVPLGTVTADGLAVNGDAGAQAPAIVFTSVTDVVQGVGVLTILSTTANPGDNTGFFKVYVGAATAWVPYFTDIAP